MIALGVNFPNIYGVHSVESLEMLYILAWNIALLQWTKKGQTMAVRDLVSFLREWLTASSLERAVTDIWLSALTRINIDVERLKLLVEPSFLTLR